MTSYGYTQNAYWKQYSCKSYLSFSEQYSIAKVSINYTRTACQSLLLVVEKGTTLAKNIKTGDRFLKDTKTIFDFFLFPLKICTFLSQTKKLYIKSSKLYLKWKKGEKIEAYAVLKVVATMAKVTAKGISVINTTLFSPLSLAETHFGYTHPELKRVWEYWAFVSLTGKGCKIFYMTTGIYESKDLWTDVLDIGFKVGDFTFRIVKLSGKSIPPAASLGFDFASSLFSTYKIFRKFYQKAQHYPHHRH